MIEMTVKEMSDRLAIASALLKNGYAVWFENRREGKGYRAFICAKFAQKQGSSLDDTESAGEQDTQLF